MARVFELHVNEQSESNLYAITSFEPVQDQQESESVPGAQTFTHIVVKGDTLWHITRRYLDNPHRYPGDVIKIIINRASSK